MSRRNLSRRAFIAGTGGAAAGTAIFGVAAGRATPAAASTLAARPAGAVTGRSGLTAMVRPDGSWQVTTSDPAWTFAGSVGAAVSDVRQAAGQDQVGRFQEIGFSYQADGPRRSGIRVYQDTPVVLFTTANLAAAANTAPFPVIDSYPELPYQHSYSGIFGIAQFNTFSAASDSPWMYFDESGDAFLLAAASHFEQAATTANSDGSIGAGIMSSVGTLPAGFTQQTMLVAGHGVNSVYGTWGRALTGLTGKKRPASDAGAVLGTLGYWTDHGATYYYSYDPSLGYLGTLQAVAEDWRSRGLPVGYLQLDSWWYPKGPQAQWQDNADGEYLYEADPQLFPDDLAAFQQQIGLPLLTHARWIDPSSPYHSEYQMSGNVITDPRFWQDRMSYLREAGVLTYEQDWLGAGAQPVYDLTAPDEFFGNMAGAAAANGLTIEYCMPLPRNYLQSALYQNVTHLRVSNDRFDSTKWDQFLYDSQLAAAVGAWPWTDVFMSTETSNLLLSNLSAGPVGVGDPIGQESADNIMHVVRPDGVIVKPDAPILPTDETYLAEAAGPTPPMIASTYTDHDGLRCGYVFAYARAVPPPQQIYQAEDAVLSGPIVATDNPGYTGTGYADYQNASGDYVQWTVQVPAAGTWTLLFRYANGGTGDRPLDITIDGADIGTLPFAPTASWTDWEFQGDVVQLPAGQVTIRATATGQSGGNIDYLGISSGQAPTVPTQTATFTPGSLGVGGPAYVYDYFAGVGTVVPNGGSYSATVTSGSYYVVVPVGRSGIAFLGDAGKFVSLGHKRITHLGEQDGAVHATVAFADGEGPVTLHGYSASPPSASAGGGSAGPVTYDPGTRLFEVTVSPGANRQATVTISS
jgi:Carbohydrate binding module (family 6)